jgi:diguanylate cyclase (GGDEF)-like protein
MIGLEEAARYRDELVAALQEDAHNEERILRRLDQIRTEEGIQAYSALLLILTRMPFEESEARRHWEAILEHRRSLASSLQREVALRVAVLDYFLNLNRQITAPRIIDLLFAERREPGAAVDRMTGLATASSFLATLQNETRRAKRYDLGLCVLYADLDNFREINERHGELVGGILLREAAILITNKIRDIDVAARLAGEEFGVILPETERMGAFLVAERIRSEVERHGLRRNADGRPIGLTLSLGIARYPDDATTADRLVQRAEEALHLAKARGGNGVSVYYRERRNFIRFDLGRGPVTIRVSPAAHPAGERGEPERRARNISRGGLLFQSDVPYAIGVDVIVACEDDRRGARMTLPARVIRVEELEDRPGHYEIGVVFLVEWEHQESEIAEFLRRAGAAA